MARRLPTSVWIGIALIVWGIALWTGWNIWASTQTWGYWEYQSESNSVSLLAVLFVATGAISLARSIANRIAERRERTRISLTEPGLQPGPIHIGPGALPLPHESQRAKTGLWLRPSAWFGIGLIVLGATTFVGVDHWMATRTFTPVDMPISLARGHIKTRPFTTNLKGWYGVNIDTSRSDYDYPRCYSFGVLKARWFLHKYGRIVATGSNEQTPYVDLGGFDADKGTYDLDVEILSDMGCLDTGHPRLRVHTSRTSCEDQIAPVLWVAALSTVIAIALLLLGLARSDKKRTRVSRVTDSTSVSQHFQWAQRLPLGRQFSEMPSFGLVCTITLSILVALGFLLHTFEPQSKGLWISLLKPGALKAKNESWIEPIIVRVADAGPGVTPNLYLNSKRVSWNDLGNAVKEELKRRPDWVVYVEGDTNIPYADVVEVVDIVHSQHAKVVLLTAKTEKP